MNLECLNDIITDNLAIHIDLTNDKSWIGYNTGLTAFSLTKWSGAISDNINLIDFGLTGFDNGRTNIMWSGITVMPSDTLFSMYKVGYNLVHNPSTGETSGVTVTTFYYPISAITTGTTENYYFDLTGGYLQGFFKLQDYNYTLFPSRYAKGITIETILYLYPDTSGIFYMMGTRAEDKYNPYFSGETITGITTISGVTTSADDYLNAFVGKQVVKKGFQFPEDNMRTEYSEAPQINNLKNNAIAFELTQNRRLAYKYIDANGLIVTNVSPTIITATGFTMIDIAFTPVEQIDDMSLLECEPQRTGKLIFYVNGRAVWTIKEFPEFYFHGLSNQKEKQLGVPYSISWGGGSFGLMHSWHYDYQTYVLYHGQDTTYINNNFVVEPDPIPSDCYTPPPTGTTLSGLSLSADSTTFSASTVCDPSIVYPITVMRIEYTGGTGNTYYVRFNRPISVLSNRDYTFNLSIFSDNFFKSDNGSGSTVNNKITILPYSDTVDIDILSDTEFVYPLTNEYLVEMQGKGLHPFPDQQEYEYSYNGILYYGVSGLPVIDQFGNQSNYGYDEPIKISGSSNSYISGQGSWKPMKSVFRTKDNTGQNLVYVGLLIETSDTFNLDSPLFVKDFTYTAADILVPDERKDYLTIEENFNTPFLGGIQKLRIYDVALTSPEILHNALMEAKSNPNIVVSKGGRIIYR